MHKMHCHSSANIIFNRLECVNSYNYPGRSRNIGGVRESSSRCGYCMPLNLQFMICVKVSHNSGPTLPQKYSIVSLINYHDNQAGGLVAFTPFQTPYIALSQNPPFSLSLSSRAPFFFLSSLPMQSLRSA